MEESSSVFKTITGKLTGRKPLGRTMSIKWEVNIGMDLKEMGINTSNWVDSAQDRGY